MQIQVNTDNHIDGRDEMVAQVGGDVDDALDRFQDQVTRVEVHLGDVNGGKGGDADIRCMIEARLAGRDPIAVHHQAAGLDLAFQGALGKVVRALDHAVGKRQEHRGAPHHGDLRDVAGDGDDAT